MDLMYTWMGLVEPIKLGRLILV